jgi:hypothetical protein
MLFHWKAIDMDGTVEFDNRYTKSLEQEVIHSEVFVRWYYILLLADRQYVT